MARVFLRSDGRGHSYLRRFAAVSMNFQNLYDFAQIWQRHFLIHFLSENAKKIGGHHVGFQDGADQSSLDCTRNFAQVFSINSAGWKAMNFWVYSNIWANTIIAPEMILRAFLLSPLFYR